MWSIPNTDLQNFPLGYGCMRLSQLATHRERVELIQNAVDAGFTLFDHADIYGKGDCETQFGKILKDHPGLRSNMVLQTKCGIRFAGDTYDDSWPARYDFSQQHILKAAEGSLQRLGVEQLDIFLLHRPDLLMQPDEVAHAFEALQSAGKVRYFGVSNFDWMQIQLLQRALKSPIVVNQVQLSLLHNDLIAHGATTNLQQDYAGAVGTLDYCRVENIGLQAWSPLGGGQLFDKQGSSSAALRETAAYVEQLAGEKNTSTSGILLAWLLRHPAQISPIIGTTRISRLHEAAAATSVELNREEWYGLLEKARASAVP